MARTPVTDLPTLEEAAELFQNIPALWMEATPQERRQLLNPLIERVYVDLETKLIGAIVPVAAFRTVLDTAMSGTNCSDVLLLTEEELEQSQVWSWWRRGRVELPVQIDYSSCRRSSKVGPVLDFVHPGPPLFLSYEAVANGSAADRPWGRFFWCQQGVSEVGR